METSREKLTGKLGIISVLKTKLDKIQTKEACICGLSLTVLVQKPLGPSLIYYLPDRSNNLQAGYCLEVVDRDISN